MSLVPAFLVTAVVCALAPVASFVWFFRAMLNTHAFLAAMRKLDDAGNRTRGVKLCVAAGSSPIGIYTRFLFGLEIPRKTIRGASDGFRDAAPAVDFDTVVREEAERGRLHFERPASIAGLGGFIGGLVALIFAFLYLTFRGFWPFPGMDAVDGLMKLALAAGGVGALGGLHAIQRWRTLVNSLRLIEDDIVPRLVPAEDMTDDQKRAASEARVGLPIPPQQGA